MGSPVTEFLNAGIVTARHPALLNPGELQRGDDCVMRDKDPAIWRAPGRVALNGVALGSPSGVKGLYHASYEKTRTDQLLAYVGTALYHSDLTAATVGTVDALTFFELSGPGQVIGTVSASTTFTATSGFPFTIDIIGTKVYGIAGTAVPVGTYVTAVSNQSGSTGHYSVITLSQTSTGATTLAFDYGLVQAMDNAGTETLDAAQYDAAYFAWFGSGELQRLSWRGRPQIAGTAYADILVQRPMGLNPVIDGQGFTVATQSDATFAWNSSLGLGVYWFLITEIFAPGGDVSAAEKNVNLRSEIVESAYLGTDAQGNVGLPIPVTVTALTGQGVRITFPAPVNLGVDGRLANNWAVYMYGPTTDTKNYPSLALMRRIKTVAITKVTAGQFVDIAEAATATAPQRKWATANSGGDDGRSDFSSASAALAAPDKKYALATSGSAPGPGTANGVTKLAFTGFSTSGVYTGTLIVGVQVVVWGRAYPLGDGVTNDAGYYVHVDTAGGTHGARFTIGVRGYGGSVFGGPSDTMGMGIVLGDLNNISVTVGKTGTGAKQRFALDAVELVIYHTGNTINLNGPAYRVVTYRDQIGVTVSEPVNLPPPTASTGCFFQGSLVLNDLSDETAIRYSLPGKPEAFPKPYVMRFNATKRKDTVKYINLLNQYLIVGMENNIERVGYLPRETDTDIENGLAHEPLTSDHGIAGPLCAAKFDMPGEGTLLAYASLAGIFLTNGIYVRPLTSCLDWPNTVKLSALNTAVLRVYPKEKWLVLYYCPAGATHNMNTRALVFHYQADKIKQGPTGTELPVLGPIVVSGRSSTEANLNGAAYMLTGHETSGVVYQEDRGTTTPPGYQVRLNDNSNIGDGKAAAGVDVSIVPFIRTRKIYGAGIERDMREQKILLLFSPFGTSTTVTSVTTVNSATITSAAAFGAVVAGMRVSGAGIDAGTIVLAKGSSSSITVSRVANATSAGVVLTFDTGTIAASIRGSGIGEAVVGCDTEYGSTITGDLITFSQDNARQGIELQLEKVPLTFDANHDTLTWADLGVNMRLHQFTLLVTDGGAELNRSTA